MAIFDSIGGVGAKAMAYATTTAFWVLLLMLLVGGFFFILWIRKRRRMNIIVNEHIDLGDGRFDKITRKGGWFRERFTLFNLWDYGVEKRFRMNDMTPVDNVSHNDYRLTNGKRSIDVIRNPHDSKICFPITKWSLSQNSKSMMAEVAPADFRSSAVKAIEQTDTEMQSKWEKYAPMIIIGTVVMISLIITILNTQYGKYMVDKAVQTITEIKNTPCLSIPSKAP